MPFIIYTSLLNYYFITGASRGIGESLTNILLREENSVVLGFSRGVSISHQNYFHVPIDLSDVDSVSDFVFPEVTEAESLCLVNNAAALTEVVHMGMLPATNIVRDYNVSLVSPTILCNQFIKQYQGYGCRRTILNISSGASQKAIESFSTYCASKAGLDMISQIIDIEQKRKHPKNPVRVFSVMPGVVDTKMQEMLRQVPAEYFSEVNRFIAFKNTNQLVSPDEVAFKLLHIIRYPETFENIILHVKDIDTVQK